MTYQEEQAEKTGNLPRVRKLVAEGMKPGEAINKVCTDIYSYNEAMKEFGLTPVTPD